MGNQVLNLTYASSLTDICELNSSFDSGVLRIAYTGLNRNGSFISKETFEKCIKTMFTCPIVCNYDRESDTLGGHDVEVVRDDDGVLTLVNLTTPVGCIPESSKVFWESVTEDDGTVHEYLCAEALLWKRQEAYKKIKDDGITAQSMEISVKDGQAKDGVYYIYDFEFTAFALIGVEPCFESASIETFSKDSFKKQLSEMMLELKESFNLVKPSKEDDNILINHSTEGGEQELDKNELIAKYGIDVEALDFSIDDYSYEELEEKFKAISKDIQGSDDTTPESDSAEGTCGDNFALISNVIEEVQRSLSEVKVQRDWGEPSRYWYVDCDTDICEVYCWDLEDWLLYGFTYEMNGDNVVINFESKKRKKYIIADFDEGEQESPIAQLFTNMENAIASKTEWEAKYQDAAQTISSMTSELESLRKYKNDAEAIALQEEQDAVFAQFEDLSGVDAFEQLKEHCNDYSIDALEDKCYAIRGRQNTVAKFGYEPKAPKIIVEHRDLINEEPYGGVFEKYGYSANN